MSDDPASPESTPPQSPPPESASAAPDSANTQPDSASAAPDATSAAPAFDPAVLKSAYNAFKKRWKLTRLDQESRIGRGPMSSGQKSTIAGIVPPDQFPKAVWDELVKQNKIKRAGQGFYSMP
jgi:hypothetical protein